jgi:hypothetical protein
MKILKIKYLIVFILLFTIKCSNAISDYKDEYIVPPPPPPIAKNFYINNDNEFTYKHNIILTMDVTDAAEMRFRENGNTWSVWEPYSDTKVWPIQNNSNTSIVIDAQFKNTSEQTVDLQDNIYFIDKLYDNNDSLFGTEFAVSDNGEIIAIASEYKNYLHVYKWNEMNYSWDLTIIEENNLSVNSGYGKSISINGNGNIIAVGVPGGQNSNTSITGKVIIYNISDLNNIEKSVIEPASTDNQYFGRSLKISNNANSLLIGAPDFNNDSGKIYYYSYSNNNWVLTSELLPVNSESNLKFGSRIDATPDFSRIATTQQKLTDEKVFIYSYNAAISPFFELEHTIEDSNSSSLNATFGYAISISANGEVLAVSEHLAPSNHNGCVYIYYASNNWSNPHKISDNSLTLLDFNAYFGYSIDLNNNGDNLLIGAYHTNTNDSPYGKALKYNYSNNNWSKSFTYNINDTNSEDQFGYKVLFSGNGNKTFIGAPKNNTGSVYIFSN